MQRINGCENASLFKLKNESKPFPTQVLPNLDVCRFDTLDLNDDNEISQEELSVLIQMSGLEELDDLFANLDKDKSMCIKPTRLLGFTYLLS